LADKAAGLRRP